MKPNKVNKYGWIILGVGLLIALIGIATNEVLFIIGLGIMFASMIFRLILFRCPHCGTYLDRGNPEYCPKCGKKVNA